MPSFVELIVEPQLNHNSTQPEPNITLFELDMKMILHTTPTTHPHKFNSMSSISRLLLIRFWWKLKCSFMGTSRTDSNYQVDICSGNICPGDISISGIYRLLLIRCWPNFKFRFLEPSLTDVNHYGDICPVNICLGNICPYQEYLSGYWLNFD